MQEFGPRPRMIEGRLEGVTERAANGVLKQSRQLRNELDGRRPSVADREKALQTYTANEVEEVPEEIPELDQEEREISFRERVEEEYGPMSPGRGRPLMIEMPKPAQEETVALRRPTAPRVSVAALPHMATEAFDVEERRQRPLLEEEEREAQRFPILVIPQARNGPRFKIGGVPKPSRNSLPQYRGA